MDAPINGESAAAAAEPALWRFAGAEFHEGEYQLRVGGELAELDPKTLDLLLFLLQHAGEVVSKDELLEGVWGSPHKSEAVITNAMTRLRRALKDEKQTIIVTQHRVGYRLAAPVIRMPLQKRPQPVSFKPGDGVPGRDLWQLIRPLGQSGVGEVWRGEHSKTGEARVFKFAFDGTRLSSLKREATLFRLLKEALGERNDFARVLDWNFVTAPFFLECAWGGVSLLEWSADHDHLHSLPPSERLRLMQGIAQAVAAAHSAGVLHKDIKPGNVLIYEANGRPEVRLTDFGSGRVTDPERLAQLGITRLGFTHTQAMTGDSSSGTPLYLAPELLAGQLPTVQADVYALGVLLYQMVVGDLRKPLAPGWERDIEDPVLRGDIAAAAQGNPALRLATAAELADRIARIEARRREHDEATTLNARAQLAEAALARARTRRPWVIGVVAVLLVASISGFALYQRSEQARQRAQSAVEQAQAINQFLNEDLIATANPKRGGRSDLTLAAALTRAEAALGDRFRSRPDLAAPVRLTLGESYLQLSDPAHAEAQLQQAIDSGQLSQDQLVRAQSLRIQALSQANRLDEAAALLAQAKTSHAAPWSALTQAQLALAEATLDMQKLAFAEAAQVLDAAQARMAELPANERALRLDVQQAQISAYLRAGKADTAEPLARAQVAELTASRGARHPVTLIARHNLGRIRLIQGHEREMISEYKQLIQDMKEVLGEDYESTVLAQHGLVHSLMKDGQWQEALPLARTVHSKLSTLRGADSTPALNALNNLSVALQRNGLMREADAVLQEGVKLSTAKLGIDNLMTLYMRINLVRGALDQKQPQLAAEQLAKVVPYQAKLDDVDTQGELACLQGRLLAQQGRPDEARPALEKSLPLLAQKNPPGFWVLEDCRAALSALPAGAAGSDKAHSP